MAGDCSSCDFLPQYRHVMAEEVCRHQCQLFAVDMAFCSNGGLVTSAAEARLVLACTDAVSLCDGCLRMSGPATGTVQLLSAENGITAAAHHVLARWPSSYSGPVSIDLEQQR